MAVINTNITSLIGQQNLNKSQSSLQTAMERLSSGLRINSAKDDAAGQAIANRMSSQVTGLNQASRNANDGISVAQTAEGALDQINDNLQRVRELTVQAQNGTNSADDLDSIQKEINQRLDEIDRISGETAFNGTKLLDGSSDGMTIQVGANDGETISFKLGNMDVKSLGLGSNDTGDRFNVNGGLDTDALSAEIADGTTIGGETTTSSVEVDTSGLTGSAKLVSYTEGGETKYAIDTAGDGSGGYTNAEIAADGTVTAGSDDVSTAAAAGTPTDVANGSSVDITTTTGGVAVDTTTLGTDETLHEIQDSDGNGTGEYVIQSGTGADATYYEATVGDDGSVTKGDELSTASKTTDPLSTLDDALKKVDTMRSDLGAIQNRFDSAIDNISTTSTNLSSARSRIEDADYAQEVSNMTRAQILQQAGTSVLAQANQVPQSVLSLLQ